MRRIKSVQGRISWSQLNATIPCAISLSKNSRLKWKGIFLLLVIKARTANIASILWNISIQKHVARILKEQSSCDSKFLRNFYFYLVQPLNSSEKL